MFVGHVASESKLFTFARTNTSVILDLHFEKNNVVLLSVTSAKAPSFTVC